MYVVSKKTEVVVKKFEELAFVNGSVSGSVDTAWGPVRIGVYARYLERWRHYFPLSQMLFVSGERLIVDPAAEMARVQVSHCKIICSFPQMELGSKSMHSLERFVPMMSESWPSG